MASTICTKGFWKRTPPERKLHVLISIHHLDELTANLESLRAPVRKDVQRASTQLDTIIETVQLWKAKAKDRASGRPEERV